MRKLVFVIGDLNYKKTGASLGTFGKRKIANFPPRGSICGSSLTKDDALYAYLFCNTKEAYHQRMQKNIFRKPKASVYHPLRLQDLTESGQLIGYSFDKLVDKIKSELKEDPFSIFDIASEIQNICTELQYEIPHVEAFNQITQWYDFMDVIDSLAEKETEYRFEFLIALVVQYTNRIKRS